MKEVELVDTLPQRAGVGTPLSDEATLRVNAAIGWLGHAVAGRTSLETATDAVAKLLASAKTFQP